MQELVEMFQALPLLGKLGVVVGILTPLLVLRSYLHPPKKPAPPPAKK